MVGDGIWAPVALVPVSRQSALDRSESCREGETAVKRQEKDLTVRVMERFARWGERGHERAARRIAITVLVIGAAAFLAFIELMVISTAYVGNGATLGTPPVVGIVFGNLLLVGSVVVVLVRQARERATSPPADGDDLDRC